MENREEEKVYTDREVIGFTIGILEGIGYPAFLLELPPPEVFALKQAVIDPISRAKQNLRELMRAYERGEKERSFAGAREGTEDAPEDAPEDPEDAEIVGAEEDPSLRPE